MTLAQRSRRFTALVRTIASSTWWRIAFFATLAVVAQWFWLSTAGTMVDYRDAQYFVLFEDTARVSVTKYHELPFWDPYYCGGVYSLGTPSARFWSPTLLVSIIFGTLRASPLIAVLMCFIGLEGTYRYARSHKAGALGAMVAAPVFALSGFFGRSGSLEWVNFLGFQLLPWAALGIRRAFAGEARGAVIAGGAVGWMTCFGGTYAAPYTLLAALFELAPAVMRLRRSRTLVKALALGAVATLLAAGIAAVRVWPIAETLAASPRILGAIDGNAPLVIAKALFGTTIPFRGDFLVGVLVLPFAVLAALERRSLWLLGAACFFLWLSAGAMAQPSGYAVLRNIPPFTMLRSPERFLVPFALFYAVLAARGLGRFEALVRKRHWKPALVAAAVLLGCINDGVLVDASWAWQRGRSLMVAPLRDASREFANARGDRWLATYYTGLNRGTLSCFDDYQVPQSPALRGDLKQEEFLRDASAGTVERRGWTPSSITLHAELTKPARIIVNQNWHPGWRASTGTVVSDEERLAVDLPSGTHDIALRFRPRSGVFGVITSLLALLACVIVWRVRMRTALQVAVAAVPLVAVVYALAFVHEPRRATRRSMLPTGEPIVQADPPQGATHIGAVLEEGITLEAVRINLQKTADGPTLDFELDWRLEHAAPPGLGIFVHFEPDKGDTVNVDHVGIATVAPFEAFPANMVLRDVLPGIAVEGSKTYKIYVGVWRARINGQRLKVINPGSVPVDADRLLVTTLVVP